MNKQIKTVVKVYLSLWGFKTVNHVNFVQPMPSIFSSLESDIAEVSRILVSGNKLELLPSNIIF